MHTHYTEHIMHMVGQLDGGCGGGCTAIVVTATDLDLLQEGEIKKRDQKTCFSRVLTGVTGYTVYRCTDRLL